MRTSARAVSEGDPGRRAAARARDLKRLVTEALAAQGLACGEAYAFATPRRLALVVENVPAKSPDLSEERKGPRVNAPEQAIAGFVKSASLKSIKEAQVVKDEKKGDFYVVRIDKPGRTAADIIAEAVPEVAMRFPWPKSMRFNRTISGGQELRWVRPLHRSCVSSTEGGLHSRWAQSGRVTRGHRFLARALPGGSAADYVEPEADQLVLAGPSARSSSRANPRARPRTQGRPG